jgi:hypothetical protein
VQFMEEGEAEAEHVQPADKEVGAPAWLVHAGQGAA